MLRRLKYPSIIVWSPNNSAILRQFCLCKQLKILSQKKSKPIFEFGITNLNSMSHKNRCFSIKRNSKSYSTDNLLQYAKEKNITKFISELKEMVDAKSIWLNNFEAENFAKELLELKFSSTSEQYLEILTLLPRLGSVIKHQKELCLFCFNGIIDELPKILNKKSKIFIFSRSFVVICQWKFHWNDLRDNKAKVEECIRNLSADFTAPAVRSIIYS